MENQDFGPKSQRTPTSLVVLANDAANVRATIAFLNRRGVSTRFVRTINEAAELFARKEATMLLLSMNIPHPKVDLLPTLIQQSFQIVTIAFAEQSDRKTAARLSNVKTKRVLFGPVSGPVVFMKIRQIEKELEGLAESENFSDSGPPDRSPNDDPETTRIGGDSTTSTHDSLLLKGARQESPQTHEAVAALLSALDQASGSSDSQESKGKSNPPPGSLVRSGGLIIQKGKTGELLQTRQNGPAKSSGHPSRSAAEALRQSQLERQKRAAELASAPKVSSGSSNKTGHAIMPDELDPVGNGKTSLRESQTSESMSDINSQPTEASGGAVTHEPGNASPNQRKSSAPREAILHDEITAVEKSRRGPAIDRSVSTGTPKANSSEVLSYEKILRESLIAAIKAVAGPTCGEAPRLSVCKHASLFVIDREHMKVAVLMATGEKTVSGSETLHKLESILIAKLRESGIPIEDSECSRLELEHLKVVAQCLSKSKESLSFEGPESDVSAMTILDFHCSPHMEPKSDDMVMIRLQDLVAEIPITFEVFLHMPVNQKYIRYLKVGTVLENKQASRLERASIQHLFVNEKDSNAYKDYFALNSILSKSAA